MKTRCGAVGAILCAAVALAVVGCADPIGFLFVGGSPHPTGSSGSTSTAVPGSAVSVGTGSREILGEAVLADRADASGILVALSGAGAKVTATTGSSGAFQFNRLGAGSYTLTFSKANYQSAVQSFQVGTSDVTLSAISLVSPVASLTLAAASDSVYLPPASSGISPLLPDTVAFSAVATKQDGLTEPVDAASLSFMVSDPTQATIGGDGIAALLGTATTGTLTVTAQFAGTSVSASATVAIKDPQAEADIRILALMPTWLRSAVTP